MTSARAAVAAMVSVCAVVVAMLGVWWSAPTASQGGSVDPGPGQSGPVISGPGQAISVASLAPGIVWAGLNYQATLVVRSSGLVTVENISVAVQAASGERFDFPGMHPATVDGSYVFTSLPRQFSPGSYTEFGTYELDNVWHKLPAQTLRVLDGPSSQVPNPPPVGIPGRWASTLNAGPGYRHGAVADAVSSLLTWVGASGSPAPPNNTYENACYSAANVTLHGRLVGLSLTRPATSECVAPQGWAAEPYYGAQIGTPPAQNVAAGAAVEADIYLPPAPDGTIADWPAFWLTGPNWPTTGEIDIMEGLGGKGCYHFNWGTVAQTQSRGRCTSIGPGWHIFGLDWQPATRGAAVAAPGSEVSYRMTYYYDGRAVGTIVQDGVTKRPLTMLLDITSNGSAPDAALAPVTMKVAYVRAWSGR